MKLAAIAILCSGCVLDVDDEELGTTEQKVSSFGAIAWGTRTDLDGADTGLPANQYACVLNGIGGDFGGEGTWVVPSANSSILATAALEQGPNGTWVLKAHTGRYGANNWMTNGVMAGASCLPGQPSANAIWTTASPGHNTWPVKVADLAPNRRCFLSAIYSGDGMLDTYESYVRVRKIDSVPPGPPYTVPYGSNGWYIESNAVAPSASYKFFVRATCIDFPTITNDWVGNFGGATNPMTTGRGVKFCGLQEVYGTFFGGYSSGAFVSPPTTQNGTWMMTVSQYKYAKAECIE